MNTIRSTWIGWGTLCVAGAGSYYFAKKQINADKQIRHEADLRRRRLQAEMEDSYRAQPTQEKDNSDGLDTGTGHPAERSKSKYEPTEVYKSRKGDRFS